MNSLTNMLKGKVDSFAEPHIDENTKSTAGGFLTLLWYAAAVGWTIYYIVGCVGSGNLLTTQTSFEAFTESQHETMMFPPMRCVNPGGCWIHSMNATDGDATGMLDGVDCYYVADGGDVPAFARRVWLTPDPVEGFSVTFNATPSFFSVSYDQVRVTDLRTGGVTTNSRGGLKDSSPKIYQGSALMQLTRISQSGGINQYSADSWASVTTSTFGGVTAPWNRCCKAKVVGLVNSDGTIVPTEDPEYTLADRRCDKKGFSQTTLSPFPTINKVQVQDWLTEGFAQFGGISSTATLFALLV
eukprot:CAMPEP_0173388724 /NCGR_PEP_ID=MMETSP1356-20130122/10961_1 /TAXON_ID=77927 ORGANISM="Hemiselmis virescens, Strain PCC157" /NCGR_SAMPLE_ID=MMETSP1356 /ASSEMBLY_ACC=CAM_ASM_000847 /LENGTH=298 /DNA_ID=CAMNT_0014345699 /DNA_START=196 /DNA_END=1088 /DNA_ORIENTATION=-